MSTAGTRHATPSARAALALAAVLIASCGGQDVPNLDSPGSTIVCLGDSITAGVGAGGGAGYPARLAERLGLEVVDLGVPGDTAAGGRARVGEVLDLDPWLVIVELGGNDFLRKVPLERTEAELAAIVEEVLAAGAVPLLVAFDGLGPFAGGYGDLYERLGERYGVPVVEDALGGILFDPALKSDAIHPNAAGYERLAAAVAETVEPLVEERRRRGLPLASTGAGG